MDPPSRRVLIAMSDAGGGHRAVSRALAGALQREHLADVHIEDVIALDPSGLPNRMVRAYPWVMRHAPLLNGIAYHSTNRRPVYRALARGGARRLRPRVEDLLLDWNPAVVVTTHPFCNRAILDALETLGRPIPVVAAVTELVSVHVSWVDGRLQQYLVATEEAREGVERHGGDPARISIAGLPVNPAFARPRQTAAGVRRALGLDPDRFTLLLVGGGEGAGRIASQVRAINRMSAELQLIVVCGRNARLRARLLQTSSTHPAAILGFVDTMPELIHAADVVVTKGGPTTIAEALVAGRPVLVTSVLPGQEEGNDRFVERHAVGFGVSTRSELVAALAQLADDAPLRAAMSARARTLMPDESARLSADVVVQVATRAGRWQPPFEARQRQA